MAAIKDNSYTIMSRIIQEYSDNANKAQNKGDRRGWELSQHRMVGASRLAQALGATCKCKMVHRFYSICACGKDFMDADEKIRIIARNKAPRVGDSYTYHGKPVSVTVKALKKLKPTHAKFTYAIPGGAWVYRGKEVLNWYPFKIIDKLNIPTRKVEI